jgi:hypothetical protein
MFEKTLNALKSFDSYVNTKRIRSFYIYIGLLWVLNVADMFQTLMLKAGGHLKEEANVFVEYFLSYDWELFIVAKLCAMVLITAMLLRGYHDERGTTIAGNYYSPDEMRRFIILLLSGGVIYYLFIVMMPFMVLLVGHLFRGTPS